MTLLELIHQEYLKLKKIERQNNHLKKIYHRQYYLDNKDKYKKNYLKRKIKPKQSIKIIKKNIVIDFL